MLIAQQPHCVVVVVALLHILVSVYSDCFAVELAVLLELGVGSALVLDWKLEVVKVFESPLHEIESALCVLVGTVAGQQLQTLLELEPHFFMVQLQPEFSYI